MARELRRLWMPPEQLQGDCWVLNPEQRHYLQRVLRLKPGERCAVINGQGGLWTAELGDRDQLFVVEAAPVVPPPQPRLTLIQGLPKQGFDEVIRQATELGVTTIQPVISDRSQVRAEAQKTDRWRKIAIEASEQSERLYLPTIAPIRSGADAIVQTSKDSLRCICLARRSLPNLLPWLQAQPAWTNLAIAIGPEGGWSDAEIEQAIAAGWSPVSLGTSILRAVTAPIVALSLAQAVATTRSLDN
ncbi:16S rRNA (uracil(1498)-N(3))-methyltransferase [Synechococcus elongatus]|uniref:Ribosomal RNA small subunit methyltransferase E n=1 Tax=Synechococcus elongatus PCC 11802 TaxID=2283154 RepID=A0AAT9K061_SYNEL|nr:16S rRNA (uracil(1498)-N(3))-methyltransferase [Synechococcus elongatus]QFZ93084.1 16S rRNA (uracil(1498)-N(3))-methyltransferase [Synechococcus elongatus PCC 11802]